MRKIKVVIFYFVALFLLAIGAYGWALDQSSKSFFIMFFGIFFLNRSKVLAFSEEQEEESEEKKDL